MATTWRGGNPNPAKSKLFSDIDVFKLSIAAGRAPVVERTVNQFGVVHVYVWGCDAENTQWLEKRRR